MTKRTCLDCPKLISRSSKGRCRACTNRHLNENTDIKARRAEALRDKMANDPTYRAAAIATIKANSMTPRAMEVRRERGRVLYQQFLQDPEIRARNQSPEARRKRGESYSRRMLGWCPPEFLDEYRHLVRFKHIPSADARRMIEERIAGTSAHAARTISNTVLKQQLRAEREREQAY